MQFDSATFVAFFATVLIAYALTPGWSARKNWLLAASWFFYASWNPWFLPLLIGSASLDWWMALRMDRAQGRARRAWLAATIGINLLVLGYFKYIGFLADNLSALLASTGLRLATPEHSIILPIGISFYTFHSLSYCIDVYRRKFPPTRNWRDYALYVAFFPQLVAGPIVRWTFMRDQIQQARRTSVSMLGTGVALMLIGLFQKVVLADSLFAPVADQAFSAGQTLSAAQAWIGTAAFSGQIFCDFAGYSTCAIGAARAFGFRLPLNFLNPYAALGLSDFWRRWHISLSTWLRDYLYIPLGGNRGSALRTARNLMITMLLGGLWHGAGWTFIIWGALHGSYLLLERGMRPVLPASGWAARALAPLGAIVTLLAVMYAWVWFRADSLAQGWAISQRLLDLASLPAGLADVTAAQWSALGGFALLVGWQWAMRPHSTETFVQRLPAAVLGLLLGLLASLILLSPGNSNAFIYFQF
mgnify:FL=1